VLQVHAPPGCRPPSSIQRRRDGSPEGWPGPWRIACQPGRNQSRSSGSAWATPTETDPGEISCCGYRPGLEQQHTEFIATPAPGRRQACKGLAVGHLAPSRVDPGIEASLFCPLKGRGCSPRRRSTRQRAAVHQ